VDPANGLEGRLTWPSKGGQVARVEPEIAPHLARKVYDAKGRLVLPGMIDTHVHLTPAQGRWAFICWPRPGDHRPGLRRSGGVRD
jgi:dihydroorotase-like cyclic amidohydrolase